MVCVGVADKRRVRGLKCVGVWCGGLGCVLLEDCYAEHAHPLPGSFPEHGTRGLAWKSAMLFSRDAL